ncbi:MAG: AAA family ATPase [Bacteroidales bacterium]|nr:AAA family ATPase [Bacteroidales bacterium]
MNKDITGIVDIPLRSFEEDKLQMKSFEMALCNFINSSEMPITVALQGEWGSGKTSLMNRLDAKLCKNKTGEFYGIWLNTWHFALLKNDESIFIEIISSLIEQVIDISRKEHPEKFKRLISEVYSVGKNIFKGLTKIAMKTAVSQLSEQAAGDIDSTFFSENNTGKFNISDLRDKLNELVSQVIEKNIEKGITKKAFVFFIDDLDRIEPTVAVTILELLKNIFDIDNCVFVLAIDYEVVVKGLKHKFGEMNDNNEREFRSFFDKIIQLPFQMPVQSYIIDDFLKESLLAVGVINSEEANNEYFVKTIASFAGMSVGANPRSIKRLVNILSFVNLLHHSKNKVAEKESSLTSPKKLILFSLASLQVAFPSVLNLLSDNPDFESWNKEFAQRYSLKLISDEISNDSENFGLTEDWQKILHQFCLKSNYLKRHFFNIVSVFKLMQQVCAEANQPLNEIISEVIDYISVTSVKIDLRPKIEINNVRVLYALNEQLLPVLESKIISPLKFVKRKGRMIAKLSYVFDESKKNNSVSIYVFVKQNNIFVKIGGIIELFKYPDNGEDSIKNIERIGKIENFNQIIADFDDLVNKHKLFKYSSIPKNSLICEEHVQTLEQYFQFSTQFIESLYSKKFIEQLSSFIIDLMLEINKINNIIWLKQSI